MQKNLIEDPVENINEYLRKKQFLWMNKVLKKVETNFKRHKSLIGLNVPFIQKPSIQLNDSSLENDISAQDYLNSAIKINQMDKKKISHRPLFRDVSA